MTTEAEELTFEVTDAAREAVLSLRAEESEAESLALWLEVTGAAGGAYRYDLYFEALADRGPGDAVVNAGALSLVIPESSVAALDGATLDVSELDGGLVLRNPNVPPGQAQGDLSSEAAQQVLRVLEEEINPSIAMHGGRADLVSVEDDVAYLRLSGGCQGCGLAAVTLSQGIEVAIKEAVPQIVSVVDVTDHAGGSNPYYEPAKK